MVEEAQAEQTQSATAVAKPRGRRSTKIGTVVSNKMDKTVVVTVVGAVTDRLYHRAVKRTSKFHAHDADNSCGIGDTVEIVSTRPLSKLKRWRVRQILKRAL